MSLRHGLNRLLYALSLLLIGQAVVAAQQFITNENCAERFGTTEDVAVRKLVHDQPEPAKICIYGLLKTYVSLEATGQKRDARRALSIAHKIARAYATVLNTPLFANDVNLYSRWSLQQKRVKAKADELAEEAHAASTNDDDDEKALEIWPRVRAAYAKLGAAWEEATVLNWMALSYRSLDQHERALEFQNRSLTTRTRIGDILGTAENFTNIGLIYHDRKKPQEMVTSLRKALDLWRQGKNAQGETMALIYIAGVYREAGQRDKFAEYLQQLLPIEGKSWYLGDQNLAALLFEMGEVFLELAQRQEAQEAFRQLEETLQVTDEPPRFKGKFLTAVADRYEKSGEMREALKYYTKASQIYASDEYREDRANALIFACIIYKNQGRGAEALDVYRQALELFRIIGDTLGMAHVYNNMGIVSDRIGQYKNALEFYDQALSLYEREVEAAGHDKEKNKSLNSHVARVLMNVGLTYLNLLQYDKALEYLKRSLGGFEQPEQSNQIGNLFLALAVTYKHQKQTAVAKQNLEKALTAYQNADDPVGVAHVLVNQAVLHEETGEFSQAKSLLEQAREIYRKFGNRKEEGSATYGIAMLHLHRNEFDQALPLFREALSISREVSAPESSWRCNMGIAMVLASQIRPLEGIKYFKAAIEDIESLRERIGRTPQGIESRIKFFNDKLGPYEGLVGTLLIFSEGRATDDSKREAFEYADRGKGRGLLDLLSESRALTQAGVPSEMLEKLIAARTQAVIYQDGLRIELGKSEAHRDPSLISEFRQRLDQVLRQERDTAREIATKFPRFAELANPRPVTLAQVQGMLLRKRQALVEYVTLPGNLAFAFVITRNSFSAVPLDTNEDELSNTVKALRASLTRDSEFNAQAAHQLYEKLFRPLESHLGDATTVYIVPDGPLHYVPFEALLTSADPERRVSSFLLNKYSFAYVSSAGVLRNSLEDQKRRDIDKKPQQPLAIFANPIYKSRGELGSQLSGNCQSLYFSPLPFSEEEAKSVARILGVKFDGAAFNVQDKATEARVKSIDLSAYRYVHFATHGLVCERNNDGGAWLQPSLVLSQGTVSPEDQRRGNDGFLQMAEIFNLKLDADLATLSACKTGLGERLDGEGLIGLTRAFMYAGTPSVLVSQWNVADKSTAIFMNRFYSNIFDGMKKGEALREAKKWMLENSSHVEVQQGYRKVITHDHPYFWAPFVLIGASE